MEVDSKTKRAFTTSQRTASLSEVKSALTDHAAQENHAINWAKATVIDRESHRPTGWIKEAIHIRKEGQQAMNHDEGSYQLSHVYNHFLDTTDSRNIKKAVVRMAEVISALVMIPVSYTHLTLPTKRIV